jgi:1-acyl-sn-glycerol-3-phosphate acyltransferase
MSSWRPPWLWRAALRAAPVVVSAVCRLRVTGDVPEHARQGPLILAANHIGAFDPFVLTAACAKRRIAPRIMATGGLFRAPVVGAAMRAAGHIRVNRRMADVTDAFGAAQTALAEGSVLLAYPEGRITLDPGMWPERGKTGLARLALATGVPVAPVAQWGAHLVLPWGAPRGMWGRLVWAITHRPVVRVHFGEPIRLLGGEPLAAEPGAAASHVANPNARQVREATDAIIAAITAQLRLLRVDEPRLPAWVDPRRPVSTARTFRRGAAQDDPAVAAG